MKRKIKNLLGTIFDIFFWIVLIACIATSVVVASSTNGGSDFPFKLFGVVQSPSMEKSGLYVGDVVFVKKEKEYAVGDVIVFYRAPAQYGGWAKDADLDGTSVWVHEIIDEKTDELGRKTFLTKGTSNAADDIFYVPQDFVLGEAKPLPKLLNAVFKFAVSPTGIILLIATPGAILFILFTLDLIYILTGNDDDEEEDEE